MSATRSISIGGTKESALAISPVNLAEPATAIGVGGYSACALLASGGVKCWGRSTVGELGYGDTSIRGSQPGSLGAALPYVPLGQKAIALSVGYLHACALLESHDVKCWGDNARGQLGIDSRLNVGDEGGLDASIPMSAIGAPVAAIHAGAEATCAVLTTGALKCWGYNGYGILGLGDGENRGTGDDAGPLLRDLAPVDLGDGGLVTGMSLGHTMTCAVREGGTAKCWGSNLSGALGLGDTLIRGDQPNEMGNNLPAIPFRNVTSIAVGMAFTCAVTEGRVKCWGNGDYGQLGLGDRQTRGDKPGYEFVLPFVDLGH